MTGENSSESRGDGRKSERGTGEQKGKQQRERVG